MSGGVGRPYLRLKDTIRTMPPQVRANRIRQSFISMTSAPQMNERSFYLAPEGIPARPHHLLDQGVVQLYEAQDVIAADID